MPAPRPRGDDSYASYREKIGAPPISAAHAFAIWQCSHSETTICARRIATSLELGIASSHGVLLGRGERLERE